MRAYKFLEGGRSPFTGWRWELPVGGAPAPWLAVDGPLGLCANGIHACAPRHLPLWVSDELWEMEIEGEVVETPVALVAARGRLVRQVEAWGTEARAAFSDDCAARSRQVAEGWPERGPLLGAVVGSAAGARAAAAGYWSAVLAGQAASGSRSGPRYEQAFLAERAVQAQWLASRLGIGS